MEAFEHLEQLLLTADYDQLPEQERFWLAENDISPEAFEQQREVLLTSQQLFQSSAVPQPPPQLQQRLARQVRQRQQRARYSQYRSIAASIVLFSLGMLLGGWLFSSSTSEKPVKEEVVVERPATILDTVYVERLTTPKNTPTVIYRDRVVHDTIFLPLAIDSLPVATLNPEFLPITTPEEVTNFSRNAKETEALLKVLVEVY